MWATKIFLSNFDPSPGKNIPTVCICLSFRPQSCGQSFFYENISTYLILNLTLHQARQNFTLAMWQLTEVMATLTMATDFIFLKLHNTEHILLILLFPVHLKISVHPKRISVYPKHFSSPKKFQDHNILNKAEWHEEISSLVLQWVSIFFSLTFSFYSQVPWSAIPIFVSDFNTRFRIRCLECNSIFVSDFNIWFRFLKCSLIQYLFQYFNPSLEM